MLRDTYLLKNKDTLRILMVSGIILIPLILYIIPLEWLENQHSVCLYKNLTGKECYGCGMTRAVLSAIHFKFANAFQYNKLVIIVLPLLVYIWAKKIINYLKIQTNQ